jgi:hypothetical protein
MRNLVEIDNEPGLARDISSHAVITTSSDKIIDYKTRRALAEVRALELQQQKSEIECIKNEMQEIKSMLKQLLQG